MPKGTILFRLIPKGAHQLEDIAHTIETLIKVKAKIDNGEVQS